MILLIALCLLLASKVETPMVRPGNPAHFKTNTEQEEFRLLHKKHGYPGVIYREEGRWYYDDERGRRCRFE